MKKHFFIFFLYVLFMGVNAQTYWDLNGNAASSSNFIGTTNNRPLIFKTNGIERMQLLPDKAFLGIGIPTPEAMLHLHYQTSMGSLDSLNLLQLTTSNITNGFSVFFNRISKAITFKQQESAKFFIEGVGGGFVVAPTGKIGFGTDAPEEKVHLQGKLLIERTASSSSSLRFTHLDGSAIRTYYDIFSDSFGLKFNIITSNGFINSETQSMFISSSGLVGIGTTAPQAKLDVAGSFRTQSASINGNISVNRVTNPNNELEKNAIVFGYEVGEIHSSPLPSKWGIERTYSWPNGDGLNFWKYSFGTVHGGNAGFKSVMYFNDSDNVGIGTENPLAKLDIAGNLKATDATFAGTLTTTNLSLTGNLGLGINLPKEKLHLENGNLLINRSTPKVTNIPNGSLIFDVQNNIDPLYNQWGIERVDSRTEGYGLNFWKYYDEGLPHKAYQMQSILFLSDNQDVGIGTRTPQKKLDVEGSFKAWSAELSGALNAQSANITETLTAKTLNIKDINISGNTYIIGKLGVGTTGNIYEQMQIGDIWTFHNGGNKYIGYNATYTSSGNVRIEQGFSSFLNFNANGSISFETSDTGAAGSSIVTTNNNLILTANGDVGIGTKNPNAKLDVSGQIMATSANINGITYINGNLGVGFSNPTHKLHVVGNTYFDGNVGIGTSNPQAKLQITANNATGINIEHTTATDWNYASYIKVNNDLTKALAIRNTTTNSDVFVVYGNGVLSTKKIFAEKIEVLLSCVGSYWYDHVFESNYNLRPLSELEQFIKQNHHLPEIPTAQEIQENGIDLGDMQGKLLLKIEELTLYVIELEKQIKELQQLNSKGN